MHLKIDLPFAIVPRLFVLFALVYVAFLTIFPSDAFAQNTDSDSRNINCISKNYLNDADKSVFVSLSTELQPSIFIDNSEVKSFSSTPICLFTDSTSLLHWPAAIPVSNIELVQIKFSKVKDLQNKVDLTVLADYPKLKFIHILSEIDVPATTVRDLLKNVPPSAIVLFTVDKPS